jgi:hypothetical protein
VPKFVFVSNKSLLKAAFCSFFIFAAQAAFGQVINETIEIPAGAKEVYIFDQGNIINTDGPGAFKELAIKGYCHVDLKKDKINPVLPVVLQPSKDFIGGDYITRVSGRNSWLEVRLTASSNADTISCVKVARWTYFVPGAIAVAFSVPNTLDISDFLGKKFDVNYFKQLTYSGEIPYGN